MIKYSKQSTLLFNITFIIKGINSFEILIKPITNLIDALKYTIFT